MKIYFNTLPDPVVSTYAVDIETTGFPYDPETEAGLDPLMGKILTIALCDSENNIYIFTHTHGFEILRPILENDKITKIIHKSTFDAKFVYKCCNILINNIYDTLLAEQILTNGLNYPVNLLDTLARRMGIVLEKETRETFYNHPGLHVKPLTNEQIKYIIDDVLYLIPLRLAQLEQISDEALGRVLRLELDSVYPCIDLELNGIKLDLPLWLSYVDIFKKKIDLEEENLKTILGESYVLNMPAKEKKQDIIRPMPVDKINFGSPKQIVQIFQQHYGLKLGHSDEDTLNTFVQQHPDSPAIPFMDSLLKIRGWNKQLGYKYDEYIHPLTGKIHPEWKQMGAGTGRFSCAKPNLQQIQRPQKEDPSLLIQEPNMRHLWLPDYDDYVLICLDYSQQEPRIMAHLCEDPKMIAACNQSDVYIEFARYIYGREVAKGSQERYISKQSTLATGYGAGAEKLYLVYGRETGVELDQWVEVQNKIRTAFPGLAEFGNRMYSQLCQYGYLKTALGRRRYIPREQRIKTIAANSPVQGTAADMFKTAMVNIHKFLTNNKVNGKIIGQYTRIWLLVHDEIEVQVHKDEAEQLMPYICKIMEDAGKYVCPSVTHIAEGKISRLWDK